MAIVAFESRGVAAGVRRASFLTTRSAVKEAVESLPEPSSGNTGLCSAAIEAIARIEQEATAPGTAGAQRLLVVLTDGKNDVRAGDDPGLETNVDAVRRAARASGMQIITIGF